MLAHAGRTAGTRRRNTDDPSARACVLREGAADRGAAAPGSRRDYAYALYVDALARGSRTPTAARSATPNLAEAAKLIAGTSAEVQKLSMVRELADLIAAARASTRGLTVSVARVTNFDLVTLRTGSPAAAAAARGGCAGDLRDPFRPDRHALRQLAAADLARIRPRPSSLARRPAWPRVKACASGLQRVEDDTLIGICLLFHINRQCRRAEIGYELRADAWGRGYMHEALLALVRLGFSELALNRIEADIDPAQRRFDTEPGTARFQQGRTSAPALDRQRRSIGFGVLRAAARRLAGAAAWHGLTGSTCSVRRAEPPPAPGQHDDPSTRGVRLPQDRCAGRN